MLQRYILANCFETFYIINWRFNNASGQQLSVPTAYRYPTRINKASNIAVQKPFLQKENMAENVL